MEIMMSNIIAPYGSPLNTVVIGVEDMEKSLHFYRDLVGLTASEIEVWHGKKFEKFWHLPNGSKADACFCELPGCNVGRVLLLDFKASSKKKIRPENTPRAYGLVNLNFYTDDIKKEIKKFVSNGYRAWSEPKFYEMSGSQGSPTEVVFDGPDTIAINLVELSDDNPNTKVGQMKIYTRKNGRTHTGLTPVVTSAHTSRDINKSVEFYRNVLKSDVLIDEILSSPEQNEFLNLPKNAQTAVKFIQGNHMFGKIALSQPINYECHDMVKDAIAPNVGYIAQVFEVTDINSSIKEINKLNCDVYSEKEEIILPGIGDVMAISVRNPGSGALQIIFQKI